MKRTSVLVTIGFLAGLDVGFFAHSAEVGGLLRKDTHAADLAAIAHVRGWRFSHIIGVP